MMMQAKGRGSIDRSKGGKERREKREIVYRSSKWLTRRSGEGEENDRPEWNPGKSKRSVGRAGAAPANVMWFCWSNFWGSYLLFSLPCPALPPIFGNWLAGVTFGGVTYCFFFPSPAPAPSLPPVFGNWWAGSNKTQWLATDTTWRARKCNAM